MQFLRSKSFKASTFESTASIPPSDSMPKQSTPTSSIVKKTRSSASVLSHIFKVKARENKGNGQILEAESTKRCLLSKILRRSKPFPHHSTTCTIDVEETQTTENPSAPGAPTSTSFSCAKESQITADRHFQTPRHIETPYVTVKAKKRAAELKFLVAPHMSLVQNPPGDRYAIFTFHTNISVFTAHSLSLPPSSVSHPTPQETVSPVTDCPVSEEPKPLPPADSLNLLMERLQVRATEEASTSQITLSSGSHSEPEELPRSPLPGIDPSKALDLMMARLSVTADKGPHFESKQLESNDNKGEPDVPYEGKSDKEKGIARETDDSQRMDEVERALHLPTSTRGMGKEIRQPEYLSKQPQAHNQERSPSPDPSYGRNEEEDAASELLSNLMKRATVKSSESGLQQEDQEVSSTHIVLERHGIESGTESLVNEACLETDLSSMFRPSMWLENNDEVKRRIDIDETVEGFLSKFEAWSNDTEPTKSTQDLSVNGTDGSTGLDLSDSEQRVGDKKEDRVFNGHREENLWTNHEEHPDNMIWRRHLEEDELEDYEEEPSTTWDANSMQDIDADRHGGQEPVDILSEDRVEKHSNSEEMDLESSDASSFQEQQSIIPLSDSVERQLAVNWNLTDEDFVMDNWTSYNPHTTLNHLLEPHISQECLPEHGQQTYEMDCRVNMNSDNEHDGRDQTMMVEENDYGMGMVKGVHVDLQHSHIPDPPPVTHEHSWYPEQPIERLGQPIVAELSALSRINDDHTHGIAVGSLVQHEDQITGKDESFSSSSVSLNAPVLHVPHDDCENVAPPPHFSDDEQTLALTENAITTEETVELTLEVVEGERKLTLPEGINQESTDNAIPREHIVVSTLDIVEGAMKSILPKEGINQEGSDGQLDVGQGEACDTERATTCIDKEHKPTVDADETLALEIDEDVKDVNGAPTVDDNVELAIGIDASSNVSTPACRDGETKKGVDPASRVDGKKPLTLDNAESKVDATLVLDTVAEPVIKIEAEAIVSAQLDVDENRSKEFTTEVDEKKKSRRLSDASHSELKIRDAEETEALKVEENEEKKTELTDSTKPSKRRHEDQEEFPLAREEINEHASSAMSMEVPVENTSSLRERPSKRRRIDKSLQKSHSPVGEGAKRTDGRSERSKKLDRVAAGWQVSKKISEGKDRSRSIEPGRCTPYQHPVIDVDVKVIVKEIGPRNARKRDIDDAEDGREPKRVRFTSADLSEAGSESASESTNCHATESQPSRDIQAAPVVVQADMRSVSPVSRRRSRAETARIAARKEAKAEKVKKARRNCALLSTFAGFIWNKLAWF